MLGSASFGLLQNVWVGMLIVVVSSLGEKQHSCKWRCCNWRKSQTNRQTDCAMTSCDNYENSLWTRISIAVHVHSEHFLIDVYMYVYILLQETGSLSRCFSVPGPIYKQGISDSCLTYHVTDSPKYLAGTRSLEVRNIHTVLFLCICEDFNFKGTRVHYGCVKHKKRNFLQPMISC